MVWKLFLWSSLRKSYSICLENSDLVNLWPFKTKIWPFFGKNWLFWEFLTYNFQTQIWIFLIFGMELLWILTLSGEPIILCLVGMEVVLMVFFEEIILYMLGNFWFGEILAISVKIWSFLDKIDWFESIWPITTKRSYESSLFLVWNCFEIWLFPGNQSYCVLLNLKSL